MKTVSLDEALGAAALERLGSGTPASLKRGRLCTRSTFFNQPARRALCFSCVQLPVVKPLGNTHLRCDSFFEKMRRINALENSRKISLATFVGKCFCKRGRMFERASTSHCSAAATNVAFLARLWISPVLRRFAWSGMGR